MKKIAFTLMFTSLFFTSCIEKYELNLNSNDQRIVIEATITNDTTQCLVKITKTRVNIDNTFYLQGGWDTLLYEPVRDALVILTDNTGQCDTAYPIDPPEYDAILSQQLANYYKQRIVYNPETNLWEYIIDQGILYQVWHKKFIGYYTTHKFNGVAGRTYTLYVKAEGVEYIAEAEMPLTVPTIDSIVVKRLYNEVEHEEYGVPLVYFKEPQDEKNYYLISLADDFVLRQAGGSKLPINLVSDEYLPDYVNGMAVLNEENFSLNYFNWRGQVYIYSLTKEAYNYYKIFFQQIENDGGAYSPAPANLPGNFSNGALGYFRASSTSVKRIIPRKKI